jgi:hypothetical protein
MTDKTIHTIDHAAYGRLSGNFQSLIVLWYKRARDSTGNGVDYFEAFIYLWFCFNAWASCSCAAKEDKKLIKALAEDSELDAAFDQLCKTQGRLANALTGFSSLWPIKDARDERDIEQGRKKGPASFNPRNWQQGTSPTWSQSLWATYQVRCNLFHGHKGMGSARDREVVAAAFGFLNSFICASGLFPFVNNDCVAET